MLICIPEWVSRMQRVMHDAIVGVHEINVLRLLLGAKHKPQISNYLYLFKDFDTLHAHHA